MSEIDDLLAELKTEYESPQNTVQSSVKTSSKKISASEVDSATNASLDNLLSDLKQEFSSHQPSQNQSQYNYPKIANSQKSELATPDLKLVEELQQEYQQQDRLEQEKKQQEIIAEQKKQQQQELRRQAALEQKARQWLQQLDLNSNEGLWFEEFSYSYESKLAAAIDYLQAIKESKTL